jgi:hypothetical protein
LVDTDSRWTTRPAKRTGSLIPIETAQPMPDA